MLDSRFPDEQRNLERRLVREQSVSQLAVIAERFAMIRSDDQQSVFTEEWRERFVESVVDECDFAEVEIACVLRGEGLGRAVGGVRIIEVKPHESLLALVRSPPTRRAVENRSRRTLLNHEVERGLPFSVVVVINIEALIEAKSRIERKRADERTRRVAGAAQHRGDGFVFRIELESGVVAHAMLIGIQTGQYVDV